LAGIGGFLSSYRPTPCIGAVVPFVIPISISGKTFQRLKQITGIGPASSAWEADVIWKWFYYSLSCCIYWENLRYLFIVNYLYL